MLKYPPKLVTAPTETPISLDEAKAQMRITSTDEDTLIETYIDLAAGALDGYDGEIRRALCTQTWSQAYDRFHSRLRLPFGPVAADGIVSVTYTDTDESPATVSSSDYALKEDKYGPYVQFTDYPSVSKTTDGLAVITFTAGTDPADVPKKIKQAILLHVTDLFENRGRVQRSSMKENNAYNRCLQSFRWSGGI